MDIPQVLVIRIDIQHESQFAIISIQGLLHPRPVRSYIKSEANSSSGVSKIRKFCCRWTAVFARESAQELASQKQWLIFQWGIWFGKVLQSSTIDAYLAFEESLLVSKLITELASISISSFQQIEFGGECKGPRASLIAHSSASKLLAQPIDLVNPFTHMLDRLLYARLHQQVQDSYCAHITIVGQNQMPDRQCMMQSREGMGGTYRLQAMLPKQVYITDSIRKPMSHQ